MKGDMKVNNPFNPTFGDVPKIFLDTDTRINDLISKIKTSDFARSFFITGVRGSGKTVFLNAVAQKLDQDDNCYRINLINKDNLVASLTKKLAIKTESAFQKALNNVNSITVKGINIDLNSSETEYDIVLEKILEKVKKQNKYVVVTIDEITNTEAVREFAQVFNELKGDNLPIFVLMTGLPDLILDIQTQSKLTFLLKSEKIHTLPLKNADIIAAYTSVFNCSLSVASRMAKMTGGYAFAFQLLGFLLFDQLNGKIPESADLDKVSIPFQLQLFDNAYQKIFIDLSEWDRKYLLAVRGNKRLQDVVKILGKDKVFVAQYRRRAIERKLIIPAGYGLVQYTLPYFDEYLKQTEDPDSAYYWGY
ncbi:AAA family ATPase [Lactobacillus gasseri]|nr:AAA family ATPase [Lactobacillus gasseri]MBW0451679.1 AAA family ATPase [Lactobacillus gasseri]MBW0452952.1 AAA family ATPase [Lactobacillus gasseri]MBW0459232.1 AAA family ATPase [Lactobacillus gasseri]